MKEIMKELKFAEFRKKQQFYDLSEKYKHIILD